MDNRDFDEWFVGGIKLFPRSNTLGVVVAPRLKMHSIYIGIQRVNPSVSESVMFDRVGYRDMFQVNCHKPTRDTLTVQYASDQEETRIMLLPESLKRQNLALRR